jgi:hypothetical protein
MAYTVVDKGSKYFDTKLYTGNGSTQSITGLEFSPDWTWLKHRNDPTAYSHQLFDVIRGATNYLVSNTDDVAVTNANTLTSFNSDGFSLGSNVGINNSGISYVGWNWLANGAGVSNTAGTISSTVSANPTSGFSIVSWTASGATSTVGHGLGTTPSMIIFKDRSNVTNWFVYHKSVGATGALYLNATNATVTNAIFFNNTAPTSSVFTVSTYLSASPHIAYCFAEVKGFSKFGSYTGNANNDGTFIYTGFKPAFVLMKRTGTADNWLIRDSARDTYNVTQNRLYPNSSSAETTSVNGAIDFLSNGFKHRSSNDMVNPTGEVCIYMAFASSPFVSSKGIPTTAR